MCCIYLPHMASDAKIQSAVTGREDSCFWLFSPWSRVGHALRSIFMLWLVKIWEVSSCGKFMQRLESCLLWQLKLTEFCVNLWCFFNVFFHWMYKMKYSCCQESSVIHGWFVYCVFGWEMRRLSKSEIRFRMASFSFSPCLICKRVAKSEAILALFDTFQELRLEW